MAINNHYVSGFFDSSGIILYLLQGLGVIDVGTQAVTASHDAMIQFAQQQKVYMYVSIPIILNIWLMPCAFPGTHKPMTRSKDSSVHVQCSLLWGESGKSTVV